MPVQCRQLIKEYLTYFTAPLRSIARLADGDLSNHASALVRFTVVLVCAGLCQGNSHSLILGIEEALQKNPSSKVSKEELKGSC